MIIVGVTGVIGTGKSTLSGMLKDRGFPVIDVDGLGRQASSDPEVLRAVEDAFGKGLVRDGSIDRPSMKDLVFRDPAALRTIEGIIHPFVHEVLCRTIGELSAKGERAAIVDHPLLFETGMNDKCSKVVVVSASEETIRRRLKLRGVTEDDMKRRLGFQIPLAEKAARADFVVNNDGSIEDLKGECSRLEAAIKEWEEE
jgi:dephospho-CoA kinase